MAIFDIACIVIIGLSIMFGVLKGFVLQIFKVAGIIGAIFLIKYMRPDIEAWLVNALGIESKVASFLVVPSVFFGVFVIVSIFTYIVRTSLKKARFGSADRILGLVLGAVKGAVICGAVFFALVQYPGASIKKSLSDHRVFINSWGANRLVEFAEKPWIRSYLPADFGFNARAMLIETAKETHLFIPEVFWAEYSALDTAEEKQEFLVQNQGRRIQTEIRVVDVVADGDSVVLTSHTGKHIEIKVGYKISYEEKYRPGAVVLVIGHIRSITHLDNGSERCVISAEAEEIRHLP